MCLVGGNNLFFVVYECAWLVANSMLFVAHGSSVRGKFRFSLIYSSLAWLLNL